MKKVTLLSIGLLCAIVSYAQNFNSKKLDQHFNNLESNNQAMGRISILKNNQPVYQKSFGYANQQNKKKADGETKYRIGSITKTYTATIILQMVEEGKLSLETHLGDFFPNIPNANKITIEDLLRHQSGLFNITNDKNLRDWITKKQSRKQMLNRFEKHPVDFEPKQKTSYSNTNFILLSYIAEDIDKTKFSSIIKKRITKPLRLKRTHFGKSINPRRNESLPYYFENNQWNSISRETHLSAPMGAGGIVASTEDVALFYAHLFHAKLFSESSLKKMTDVSTSMGLGISSMNYKGLKVYDHDGGIDGFSSFALHIPERDVTLAITLNGASSSMLPLVISILDIYFENDPSLQSKSTYELSSKDLDVYLGTYTSKTFPVEVAITKKGNVLFAQATGQPLFKLIAEKKHVFKYDAMGISFTFSPTNETLSVVFEGNTHLFKKKKS